MRSRRGGDGALRWGIAVGHWAFGESVGGLCIVLSFGRGVYVTLRALLTFFVRL